MLFFSWKYNKNTSFSMSDISEIGPKAFSKGAIVLIAGSILVLSITALLVEKRCNMSFIHFSGGPNGSRKAHRTSMFDTNKYLIAFFHLLECKCIASKKR